MTDDSRRKHQRKTLTHSVPVEDVINGGHFGELVNLTVDGLMIITDRLPAPQAIFQLALRLPQPIEGEEQIVIGVDCLWARRSDDYHRYWAGFSIIDISDADQIRLEVLLREYGD